MVSVCEPGVLCCACCLVLCCLPGDAFSALVQYVLVAEQGSVGAAANAAFMLRRGAGFSGPGRMDMALKMFQRCGVAQGVCGAGVAGLPSNQALAEGW